MCYTCFVCRKLLLHINYPPLLLFIVSIFYMFAGTFSPLPEDTVEIKNEIQVTVSPSPPPSVVPTPQPPTPSPPSPSPEPPSIPNEKEGVYTYIMLGIDLKLPAHTAIGQL